MRTLTRRRFIQAGSASALAVIAGRDTHSQMLQGALPRQLQKIPKGYLLVQELSTYEKSKYSAISTAAEAEQFFSVLKAAPEGGLVNALEYASLSFGTADVEASQVVAKVAVSQGIDLWVSTYNLLDKIPALGPIAQEYQSSFMLPNGMIVPTSSHPGAPVFDVLNPEAMDWFIDAFKNRYVVPMRGLVSGLFLNEDKLPHLGARSGYNIRPDYWYTPVYSERVLRLWRQYCRQNEVIYRAEIVTQFPVHDATMVSNGGGMTAYYPGWDVPASVQAGQLFVDLPRAKGVWEHWYEFICTQYLNNYLGRLAKLANDVNRDHPVWKGTIYFGLHTWSLPYEEIKNPRFAVPAKNRWGAWGRQYGVDLEKLARHSEIDIVICETFPSVAGGNLADFVGEWSRITREANKTFGVMMDRDDHQPLTMGEERARWSIIDQYQPTVITRYPRARMQPNDPMYRSDVEIDIAQRLKQYRRR